MENQGADWILDLLNDVGKLLVNNGLLRAADRMNDVKLEMLLEATASNYLKGNIVDLSAYKKNKLETSPETNENLVEITD